MRPAAPLSSRLGDAAWPAQHPPITSPPLLRKRADTWAKYARTLLTNAARPPSFAAVTQTLQRPDAWSLSLREAAAGRELVLAGKLDLAGVARAWPEVMAAAAGASRIDLAALESCDTAGATLLIDASRRSGAVLDGARHEVASMLARIERALPEKAAPAQGTPPPPWQPFRGSKAALAFAGEVAVTALRAPAHTRMLKLRDIAHLTEAAGTRAIPLVLLLGFLMGLILAFQSSIPLRRFGAEVFIVNLVVISLLRELGPLLAAVVMAGRTSSAFAAELGTMVVNDEVAALRTMGIDPMTMLVLPRMAAAVLAMPALTLLLELAGLAGMGLVMRLLGFPFIAVVHQIVQSATLRDLGGGLIKAVAFGIAVAAIGCRRGLAAGIGPRAVGEAATGAVVGSIVVTILIDGLFTILYFRLGL